MSGSDVKVRLALEEYALRVLLKRYQTNPIAWLTERFGEKAEWFKWSMHEGYENHHWDGTPDPIFEMWQAVANSEWCAVKSATGTGKTFSLARVVYWFLDCFPNSLVVTTTPKEAQLKLHLWTEIAVSFHKFKRIRPNAELQSLRLIVDKNKEEGKEGENEGWQAVGFVAGVGANEESATKAQGFHREHMLIIMEETPGIGLPVIKAFENTSTGSHNIILALGNPDSKVDSLSLFEDLESVRKIRISAIDHPNIVTKQEIYKGAVSIPSIERRKDKYGVESNFYRSRVRGITPDQSQDSLIHLDWIKACVVEEAESKGKGAVGIDVANSEAGDMAALAWGKDNILFDLQEFQCSNATHLAYNLLYDSIKLQELGYTDYHTHKLSNFNVKSGYNVGIDGVGVGVATVNAFNDKKMKVVSLQGGQLLKAIPKDNQSKPLYQFNSLRSQMYWELREDLRQGKIWFCIADKTLLQRLMQELIVPKVELREKIAVEPKENIKRRLGKSPNLADAVAYWNWVRKGYYTQIKSLPFGI